MIYEVKCLECGEVWDTSFGIVGTAVIAQPSVECPFCKSTKIEGVHYKIKEKEDE